MFSHLRVEVSPGAHHQLAERSEAPGADGLREAADGEPGGVGLLGVDV